MNTKMVIVLRKDLKMRRGKEIAQCAHAALGLITKQLNKNVRGWYGFYPNHQTEDWLEGSFRKIVVTVDSQDELLEIYHKASNRGIDGILITDNGDTEFHGVKTITCCALGPDEDKKIDEITGHLKLY